MKIAVLSDVHGNHVALEAVLEDARRQGVDHYILAGDYVCDCPQPNQVLDCIRALEPKTIIKGNKEDYVIRYRQGLCPHWEGLHQMAMAVWTGKQISQDNLAFIQPLPFRQDLQVNGTVSLCIIHGSLDDPHEVIHKEDNRKLKEHLERISHSALIHGHSHRAQVLSHAGRQAFNPGALGLPLNPTAQAEYGILQVRGTELDWDHRYVDYDKEQVYREFKSSGALDACGAWAKAIIQTLQTGRNVSLEFLRHAHGELARQGRSAEFIPNELWDELDARWDWKSPRP